MSDGRFQRESREARLARYRKLLASAESDVSRFRAEIKALERRMNTCPGCDGSGKQMYLTGTETGNKFEQWTCEECCGTGKVAR